MKYIYQHLGIGDALITNGLVRSIVKNEEYTIFCIDYAKYSIDFMYRDMNNVKILSFPGDSEIINYCVSNKINPKMIGFKWLDMSISFEKNFYKQYDVDFEEKWNNFKVSRDEKSELDLYERMIDVSEYIFVHDDNRFKINENFLSNKYRIVRPIIGMADNIFMYSKIIENAKEVHCIESSFAFMIDIMGLNKNFYIHRYARKISIFETPIYKNCKEIFQ